MDEPRKGRPKGSPNKDVIPLREKARELGIDPFEILLHFANGNWEELGYFGRTETKYSAKGEPYEVDLITPDLRVRAASDACQYLYAKRKAIEHDIGPVDLNEKRDVFLHWADEPPPAPQTPNPPSEKY